MTLSSPPTVLECIREGRIAATAGDTITARSCFRRATELDPASVDAWFGLSNVVPTLAEKRIYLQRILEIDPTHAEARASLEYIEQVEHSRGLVAGAVPDQSHTLQGANLTATSTANETTYCYRHPDRETGLHCTSCNQAICTGCSTVSSVGQLCPECLHSRRPTQYRVSARNVVLALLCATLLTTPIAFLVAPWADVLLNGIVGFFTGLLIVQVIDRVTRLKRGRAIQMAAVAGFLMGTAMGVSVVVISSLGLDPEMLVYFWEETLVYTDVYLLLFVVIGSVTLMTRLK